MYRRPGSSSPSKDSRQLDEQVWPALESHRGKFPALNFTERRIESPQSGIIIGFTTDDPNRAEGWHSKITEEIDSPVIIICDEAKSIQEGIFKAFAVRCTFNGLLYISSTGEMSGEFYRSQLPNSSFKRYRITIDEPGLSPFLDYARIKELRAEYPPDDPFLRSTLYAEFMSFDGAFGAFTSLAAIQKCLENPPQPASGDTIAFCDFAGGGAENVLAVRRGNKVEILRAWREVNEMVAVGEFIVLFREHGLRPEEIWGDNCGAGKPMIARFHELGWPINRLNGNAKALREWDFADRNAEVWEMGGREIARGKCILPRDEKLFDQLVQRKRSANSAGKLVAESKEEMAKRGLKSPDRADAVMGVLAIRRFFSNTRGEVIPSWMDYLEEEYQDDLLERVGIKGCDAGL